MEQENKKENNSTEWEIDNLPNRLTVFRMVLIPIIIGSLSFNMMAENMSPAYHKLFGYIAAWTFAAAAITDFFDGYIARKKNIVTVFGSFLDPVADKFLVVSSIISLHALDRIPTIIVIILVLREFYITSLRLLAMEKGFSIPVGKLGKWKTAAQMVGVPFLMANDTPFGMPLPLLGTILIYISSIFSIYSAVEYSIKLIRKFRLAKRQKKQKTD